MRKKIKIGIAGCGAIGSSLARAIAKNFPQEAKLAALYDTEKSKSLALSLRVCASKGLAAGSLSSLIRRCDLVVECASSLCSWDIARNSLARGRDVMIMSVGGVINKLAELERLAGRYGCRVYIPSGALCGIDALKAARFARIKSVTLTTRKHPLSFKGVKYIQEKRIDLRKLGKEKVLFSGAASLAVKHFPQNINVAAVLSMAGIGQARTKVRIIASRQARRNIHEVRIESSAGDIITRTENVLHPDNPKTSYLAVLAAVATLKGILAPVRIGT